MQFKRTEDLKTGMRLARPIYNRDGVLLYERNSKLTTQGIVSIRNFGLIGIYILEPAEPVPPMTPEDIEFERFQSVSVFAIKEELDRIKGLEKSEKGRTGAKIEVIVANITKSYGHMDKKLNFIQNLRSPEDYIYKHALNVAILCAMMGNQMNLKVDVRTDAVRAALLCGLHNYELIDKVCSPSSNVKRYCQQSDMILKGIEEDRLDYTTKFKRGAQVLSVARIFDNMTAMSVERPPESEGATLKYLLEKKDFYSEDAVNALIRSINILNPGVCVELNTGDKALVLAENTQDVLNPMVLSFSDNTIIDLSSRAYADVEIVDVMKTMDNRHVMDTEMLRKQGFNV